MTGSDVQAMLASSHISGSNAEYVDNLYELYLKDPNAVSNEWRDYFDTLSIEKDVKDISHADIRTYFKGYGKRVIASPVVDAGESLKQKKQAHVLQLINAYREHGHHLANLDPLNLTKRIDIPDLELQYHGLSESDLDTVFSTESSLTYNDMALREIYQALKKTYCHSIGIEYMHISDHEITQWFQERLESIQSSQQFSKEEKNTILKHLTASEGLEKYLGAKYVGQMRFSLEGSDTLIPMLRDMVQRASNNHVKQIIIGMTHRGRLNVLVNILGKSPEKLFAEFEGKSRLELSGDVKYHMGFSSDLPTKEGSLHLTLAFNPSHLEIIAPVVEGSVRARQRCYDDLVNRDKIIPVLIHGDASFSGQGVVMETFNFSQARGYCTGGTIHVVINNQIGFTTSNPLDARSTLYCTDVAKMVQAPIIHVNGDDPEAAVFAMQLAFDFRMKFKKDVVVDLVCYRRQGHNEADEPAITQPLMYSTIRNLPTVREMYAKQLIADEVTTETDVDQLVTEYRDALDKGDSLIKTVTKENQGKLAVDWQSFLNTDWREKVITGIPLKKIRELGNLLVDVPDGFTLHPVVKRLWEERKKMTAGEVPINWGYAEMMAYASLIEQNYPLRLSGQDSGRGTFTHRHAVLYDYKTGAFYNPLQQITSLPNQAMIIDSILSEEAVLGFEYGYAATDPGVLVIWEAQYGDFANGAQVVIDQFISSGEQKWGRMAGLVMYLPHAYEGKGPEHSSARLERFLQLCAEHNMQICIPTTPAQTFHMLRRQMLRNYRKPLVVMTPKSLLRSKLAVSSLEDLEKGKFNLLIPEIDNIDHKKARKVILCAGKVYYDLLQQRRKSNQKDVAIIRIEQLYPFPTEELQAELRKYKEVKDIIWCQEEPKNQGAWFSSRHHMEFCLREGQKLQYVGRDFFAAPAVGYLSLHMEQQNTLIEEALRSS